MDPTTLLRPSPEKSPPSPPPPYPPQNPHTPTDAIIEASDFDYDQKAEEPTTSRSMEDFKPLMLKLARRLLPAHKSLINQRFDDIIPDEFLVPDHPPYADMILTALWELKSEGGSSEEAISDFIEKEYHDLPWAHTTILNHHLKDLCKKGRITMKHDKCYLLCSSITKPIPNCSPSPSPPSTADSSSSASICSSPTSSSSSLSWARPYRTQKRKRKRGRERKNIRGKRVQTSGRGRGMCMGTSRGRGRGRGRGRAPIIIQVGQRRSLRDMNQATKLGSRRYHKEFNTGEESQMEDQNEVTDMEVEDCSAQDGVTARTCEEENVPCEQHKVEDKEQRRQKLHNVIWIGRRVRKPKEAERDILEEQSDDEVTELEDDVSSDKNEKDNQQSDNVEEQTLGEEQPTSGTANKIMACEAQVAAGSLGKQHNNTAEAEIQPKIDNKEEFQTHEQQKGGPEQKIPEKTEAEEQDDFASEKLESKEQSEEQHNDVSYEPVHWNDDSLQSCGHDQLKNVEQSEEHHDDVNDVRNDDFLKSCGQDQLKNVEQLEERDHVNNEPIHWTDDSLQFCGQDQLKNVEHSKEQYDNVNDEAVHLNEDPLQSCGQVQLKSVELSEEPYDDINDEPVHQNEYSLQSCGQDELKNVEQSEEHRDDINDEPIHGNDDSLQSCGLDELKNVEQSEERHDDINDEPIHGNDNSLRSCGHDELKNVEQSEEHHDDISDEPIHGNDDSLQSCGQDELKNVEQSEEHHDDINDEPIHGNDDSLQSCGQDELINVEQPEEHHDDINDEPIHGNDYSLQSCGQDELKIVEAESAEDQPQQEQLQTEVCQKETVLQEGTEVQQEECVEMIEEQNQLCIQQTEIIEKELLQEENDALSDENSASSGSLDHKQHGEQRSPLRQRLRSSCKIVDATPKIKKQIDCVTPVRRSLRCHKTISEATVITEVPDSLKEQLKHSGRAMPSKRKPNIAEAEQASNLRRSTRRTG